MSTQPIRELQTRVQDEIAADPRVADYTHYEDDNEVYMMVSDENRHAVMMHYKTNYNVDVEMRGLKILVSW